MRMSTNGIVIVGCISDAAFHRCCKMAQILKEAGVSVKVPALPLFETQWEEYLQEKKTQVGGNIFEVQQCKMLFYVFIFTHNNNTPVNDIVKRSSSTSASSPVRSTQQQRSLYANLSRPTTSRCLLWIPTKEVHHQ